MFLLLLTLALQPLTAWALGLGDIQVKSSFNKKFTAIIPIFLGEDEGELKLEVGRPRDYELMQLPRPGLIDKLELAIAPNPENPSEKMIIITSPEPIQKPSFNLIIRLTAGGGTILENYFLAVDFRKSLTLELPKEAKIEKEVKGRPDAKAEEKETSPPEEPTFTPTVTKEYRIARRLDELKAKKAEPKPAVAAAKPAVVVEKKVEKIAEPQKPPAVVERKVVETLAPETVTEVSAVELREFITISSNPAKNRHVVRRTESLYVIAKKLGASQKDLPRVVVALYLANRSAFIGGNIHLLKAGAKLNYDKVNEIASNMTRFDSAAFIERHDRLRKTRLTKAPITIEMPVDGQVSAQEIYAFLENWKREWMEKNLDAFADNYAESFRDSRGKSRSEFLGKRAKFTKSHNNIKLLIENINIVRSGPVITLYFSQWFRSDSYNSVGLKQLMLLQSAGGLKIVYEEYTPRRASPGKHGWTVHLASYQGKATTTARIARLRKLGFRAFEASSYKTGTKKWYRLMVGRLATRSQAIRMAKELKKAGEIYTNIVRLPFALEVSVYDNHNESVAAAAKLRKEGLSPYLLETVKPGGNARYHLYLGAFAKKAEAVKTMDRLAGSGLNLRVTAP